MAFNIFELNWRRCKLKYGEKLQSDLLVRFLIPLLKKTSPLTRTRQNCDTANHYNLQHLPVNSAGRNELPPQVYLQSPLILRVARKQQILERIRKLRPVHWFFYLPLGF